MSVTDAVLIGVSGDRLLYAGLALREDLPTRVLEGLVRRRLVATAGQCPCGARLIVPSRAARRAAQRSRTPVLRVAVEHEDDCPALDPRLERAGVAR